VISFWLKCAMYKLAIVLTDVLQSNKVFRVLVYLFWIKPCSIVCNPHMQTVLLVVAKLLLSYKVAWSNSPMNNHLHVGHYFPLVGNINFFIGHYVLTHAPQLTLLEVESPLLFLIIQYDSTV